jgi:putative transposase
VRRLCKVLGAHPSGFYALRLNPESYRATEEKRLLVPIKESWLEKRQRVRLPQGQR